MIGRLKGLVDAYGEDHLILDVQGVGYLVHCSGRTLQNLPPKGEALMLIIDTHVREDMIRLYGFLSETERDWFRLLQNVQGVGAKVALAMLSVLDGMMLTQAIASGDKGLIARTPGIGPKLALRIVTELKDKVGSLPMGIAPIAGNQGGAAEAISSAQQDAVSALVNLGYGQAQAFNAVKLASAQQSMDADTKTLIRYGLKELSKV
jgi:holliday junction DNA helicase RuvA